MYSPDFDPEREQAQRRRIAVELAEALARIEHDRAEFDRGYGIDMLGAQGAAFARWQLYRALYAELRGLLHNFDTNPGAAHEALASRVAVLARSADDEWERMCTAMGNAWAALSPHLKRKANEKLKQRKAEES